MTLEALDAIYLNHALFNDDGPATATPASPALQLVCSEVWGGNRPIHRPVELPGMRGVLYSKPSDGGRGGDVHYLSVCGSGLLARMCLADVVGHGEAVATVSTELHKILRGLMNWPDQRRVLGGLNERLDRIGFSAITTAVAVTYYPPSGKLSVSYAGHPPAWYFRAGEQAWSPLELERTDAKTGIFDIPLAVDPNARYSRRTIRASRGDRIMLVTDGVLEAPNPKGELFGVARVNELLREHPTAAPEELGELLLSALRRHTGDSEFGHDDVTFLIAEVVDGPRGPALWHMVKNRLLRPKGNSSQM